MADTIKNLEQFFTQTALTSGFFITGTQTNIGKTYITCKIAHILQNRFSANKRKTSLCLRKPIASGCIRDKNNILYSEDALALYSANLQQESLKTICPYLFEAPISPARAIKQAQSTLNLTALITACQTPHNDFILVEGAGGFYSPLTPDALNKDLAVALAHPIILVVGNVLGCINQCLLTLDALEKTPLNLAAIIVNDIEPDCDFDNVLDIQTLTPYPVLHQPYCDGA